LAEEFVGCVRGWQTEASFFCVNHKVDDDRLADHPARNRASLRAGDNLF
jgi:hypothetical protein